MNPSVNKKKTDLHNSEMTHRVGVLMADSANSFWADMKNHYERIAPELGLTVEIVWPLIDQDPESQIEALFDMLDKSFDAIVINPLNKRNLVPGIFACIKKEIPVLDAGAKTDQFLVKDAMPHYIPVSTVDFYEQGVMGAEYILKRLGLSDGGKVAIIEGRKESAQSIGRSQGAADVFLESPSIQVFSRKPAGFDRKKALDVALDILKQEPEIRAFFCANDLMALGVADAADTLEKRGHFIIVGVDLIDEARKAIRDGRMDASIAFSRASVVRMVLKEVTLALGGESYQDISRVESHLVSKENVDTHHDR